MTPVIHIALGILLFYCVNWIGSKTHGLGYEQLTMFREADSALAYNFLFRVLAPVVYMILVSTAMYAVGMDKLVRGIWLVSVYYVAYRVAYNVGAGHTRLLNWPRAAVYAAGCIALSYGAYALFIARRVSLLPDGRSMITEMWLVVIAFLYYIANRLRLPAPDFDKRRLSYLDHRFQAFRRKYGTIVDAAVPKPRLKALVYAIMVYENFNRPPILRAGERIAHRFRLARTTGIMQVKSEKSLSDVDSVRLAVGLIQTTYDELLTGKTKPHEVMYNDFYVVQEIALRYNPDRTYAHEVAELWHIILERYFEDSSDPLIQRGGITSH